jgi:phage recombination protein Bet
MTTAVAKRSKTAAVAIPHGTGTSVLSRLAMRFGVEPNKMMECLKATAFKGSATNEQIMALCIVADQYGLNPWTKEIYAFPDKNNGIVPVVGVDGWARIINEHPEFDGMEFDQDDESCTCVIHRKDRNHPISVTEYMDECKRNTGPWGSHPKRMLRHKAMVQAARMAFGFAGIKDPDEAERIVEGGEVSPAPYDLPKRKQEPVDVAEDSGPEPSQPDPDADELEAIM